MKIETRHPEEWPWRRWTGPSAEVPPQWSDLVGWWTQPLGDVALALGHAVVLTGHEVSH